MTQEEIIELAKQVARQPDRIYAPDECEFLYYFAKLIAEKERERYMQLFLDPENQPTQFGTATQEYREQEIKQEREACAKIADEWAVGWPHPSQVIAERIRERT